jgi:peptide/nickel transport system permease protein
VLSPWLAVHPPARQHRDALHAPPVVPRVLDADGLHAPFVHPLRLADPLARRYEADRTRRVPLRFLSDGRLVTAEGWFPLGTDTLGRDVWSRLVTGARLSLGIALLGCLGALLVGALVGGLAGVMGGLADAALMRLSEMVLVLPALYLLLVLRAALPLVLPDLTVFLFVSAALALLGWPSVARVVRAVVAREAALDYAAAAVASGAGRGRLLFKHLLPAALPALGTQALLLAPAFILAEATLSYAGLGFMPPAASWGTMLQDAANVRAIADSPWMLVPALAIALVVLAINLVLGERGEGLAQRQVARTPARTVRGHPI